MKRTSFTVLSSLALIISFSCYVKADNGLNSFPIAPYLLVDAPTFDMTIAQFRDKYNADHPDLPLNAFQSIKLPNDTTHLTRAASKINAYLYASTALEKGSGKIKTIQITYLPKNAKAPESKMTRATAISYMAALMQSFDPTLTKELATKKVENLLVAGKRSNFYQQTANTLRYIIVDKQNDGITFAIEPVKLVISDTADTASNAIR